MASTGCLNRIRPINIPPPFPARTAVPATTATAGASALFLAA